MTLSEIYTNCMSVKTSFFIVLFLFFGKTCFCQIDKFEGRWMADTIKNGQLNFLSIINNDSYIVVSMTKNPSIQWVANLSIDSSRLNFLVNNKELYFEFNKSTNELFLYQENDNRQIQKFNRDCYSKINDYSIFKSLQDNSVVDLDIKIEKGTKVLLVFPHADDEIAFTGLIRYLINQGAIVHYLLLGHSPSQEISKTRVSEVLCASKKIGIEKVEICGLITNPWENVLNDSIDFWYENTDSIKNIIKEKIDRFQPEILITWDTKIGGYGHPEHRISAQLTYEIFFANDSLFDNGLLFQFTAPERMANLLFGCTPTYEFSKRITGNDALPPPNVSLNITQYWPVKNKAAACHKSQKKVMENYYLLFNKKDKKEHISAFNKEYYVLIKK